MTISLAPLVKVNAYLRVAAGTIALLLVPLLAMQFSESIDWGIADFLVMAVLLFSAGSVFVLVSARVRRKHRGLIAIALLTALLYVWAELAVGVFTTLGS